jgi:RNA polymerase sigma factor (sigma-70 family)
MAKVKVILASNHELWWDGLSLLIERRSADIEVLAMCYEAIETINKANELRPDVILLDEEIDGGDCGEVAQRINELHPEIKIIIVMKPYQDINYASSFKARAKAYINKDITYAGLESSIRHVAKGGVVVISPLVAQKLLEQVASYGDEVNVRAEYNVGLSRREKEVLALLAEKGTTNKEIAEALHITENTVKAHLSSILEKMQVRNRQQAAILARESGIIPESDIHVHNSPAA